MNVYIFRMCCYLNANVHANESTLFSISFGRSVSLYFNSLREVNIMQNCPITNNYNCRVECYMKLCVSIKTWSWIETRLSSVETAEISADGRIGAGEGEVYAWKPFRKLYGWSGAQSKGDPFGSLTRRILDFFSSTYRQKLFGRSRERIFIARHLEFKIR